MQSDPTSNVSRRRLLQAGGAALGLATVGSVLNWTFPETARASGGSVTDWLVGARWGVFNQGQLAECQVPAITTVTAWNAAVNAFDVEGFANQLQLLGAGYVIHLLGQNSGFYTAPNATYDGYVKESPSRCSTRDLVADLYAALNPRGIKLMVYLPSGAPNRDSQAVSALQWTNGASRNANFQVMWQNIIQEWSDRWGTKVAGWWFDGCYWPDALYNFTAAPNWATFAAAARHGNPNAILAFNPGVQNPIQAECPQEDFTAGEMNDVTTVFCNGRYVTAPANVLAGANSQVQYHMLSYLSSQGWGKSGTPRYTNAQVISAINEVVNGGGVVTWDAPLINPSGLIDSTYLPQLATMSSQLLGRYTVNDTDPGIAYTGSWHYDSGRNVPDIGNDVHYTTTNGDYAQFTFNGSGIQYITEKDSDMGNVDVYLNGNFQETVNCYHTGGKLTQQVLYQATGLASGNHTIKIVKRDGTYAIVDGFQVLSTTATVIADSDPGITYTGSWGSSTGRAFTDNNQDVHYTTTNGDYFQYTFNGTGIQYLTENYSDMGNVDIYLNGVFQQTVNCYTSGTRLTQQPVFTKLGLAAGSYTIKVVKKDGTYAILDALRVFT